MVLPVAVAWGLKVAFTLIAGGAAASCATTGLSSRERIGSEPEWRAPGEGFVVKGPCREDKSPRDLQRVIAQDDALYYANLRALIYWATEDPAGLLCRGRVIKGGVSRVRGFNMFDGVPLEYCSDGKSLRGIVDVALFNFTCSQEPCGNQFTRFINGAFSACIPPGTIIQTE